MDEACYQQCMGTEGVDPNGCWYDCNVRPPGPSSSECYADCMAEIGDDLTCAEDCECDCACSLDCE